MRAAPTAAVEPSREFSSEIRVEAQTYHYAVSEIQFPSRARGPFRSNDTVWGHLYLPRGIRKPPCVLLLPVMAAPNVWIETRFIHELVANRYAVLWIEMPYQFHRRPSELVPSGQVFLARNPERLAANFRQAVADARRAVDWLERSGQVDPERIGLFGISLGAIVGSVVLSQDARLRGGVLLLGGSDFPSLVMRSSMTRDVVSRSHLQLQELRKAWRGLDPAEYRESNRRKRVQLINVRSDTVIPRENALKLKEAFPDAGQLWLPLGHYSAMVHLLWVPSHVAWSFHGILGSP